MTKNTGLGKGLEALFGDKNLIEEDKIDYDKEEIKMIKLSEIEPDVNQARKEFNEEELNNLADSIKEFGVIQPIIVEDMGKYYKIIAGERRWRASKIAGKKKIPCIVRNMDENTRRAVSLIENVQRSDLNAMERAQGYQDLLDSSKMSIRELARKLGISRLHIQNHLRLLRMDKRLQQFVRDGKLGEGQMRRILSVHGVEQQVELAKLAIERGYSAHQLERMATEINNKTNDEQTKAKNDKIREKNLEAYKRITGSFEDFFGTKVEVKQGTKCGQIIIKYRGKDELDRILSCIDNK